MGTQLKTPYASEVPPLSDDAYAALKADIKTNGQMVPVYRDESGNILDGHHRYKILGTKAKTQVVKGLTEPEKRAFVHRWANNRRSLSSNQRKELAKRQKVIAAELRAEDAKKWTQAKVAAALGVPRSTVANWSISNVPMDKADHPRPDARVKLSAEDKQLVASQLAAGKSQRQVAANFGVCKTTIAAVAKKVEKDAAAEELRKSLNINAAEVLGGQKCRLLHGALAEVGKNVPNDSIDCIITDPPYPREFLPCFDDLGTFAARVLKPGGSLICMSGQSYLPDVYAAIGEHLVYHWTAAYLTPGGQAAYQRHRKVNTFWKPLLWYVKGTYTGKCVGDVCRSETNNNEKEHHHWGQSVSGMTDIVERFSQPGWHVCDPFLGGGTTGAVCLTMGRVFTGIEVDEGTLATAKERIANHVTA